MNPTPRTDEDPALMEEDRRVRAFRFLTALTHQRLCVEPIRLDEARAMVEKLKRNAERFFPGRGHVFDLVVRPRLERVIDERFLPRN
jgi:hypothetical protein